MLRDVTRWFQRNGYPKLRFESKSGLRREIHPVSCEYSLELTAGFRLMGNAMDEARGRMGKLRQGPVKGSKSVAEVNARRLSGIRYREKAGVDIL